MEDASSGEDSAGADLAWGPSRRKLSRPALLSHVTQRGRGIGKKARSEKRGGPKI
jgi:hypothetical protein